MRGVLRQGTVTVVVGWDVIRLRGVELRVPYYPFVIALFDPWLCMLGEGTGGGGPWRL